MLNDKGGAGQKRGSHKWVHTTKKLDVSNVRSVQCATNGHHVKFRVEAGLLLLLLWLEEAGGRSSMKTSSNLGNVRCLVDHIMNYGRQSPSIFFVAL